MDLHSGCAWKGQCRLFHFLWKAGYNGAILLSMLHTGEALAAFHVVQSSSQQMESPLCSRCSTHTSEHGTWFRLASLLSENESSASIELRASESSFLKHFVLPFPTFLIQIHNISCAWAEESGVSQPTNSAAIILIYHCMQPVSLPSEQGQALLGDLRVQSSALNFSCHLVLDHTSHVLLLRADPHRATEGACIRCEAPVIY